MLLRLSFVDFWIDFFFAYFLVCTLQLLSNKIVQVARFKRP